MMDDVLDLSKPLDVTKCELRDLLSGRAAIAREVRSLTAEDATADDATADRVDGLIERGEAIDAEIAAQRQAQRSRRVQDFIEPPTSEQRSRRPVPPVGTHIPRGSEPPAEQRDDPVLHPDGGDRPYSLLRAIRLRSEQKPLDGKEAEVSQEIAHRADKPASGFYLPWTLPCYSSRQGLPYGYERRDFTATAGAGLIPAIQGGSIVDLLRNRLVMARMGAAVLTGMVGTFDLPKLSSGGTAYWVAEGNAPTESAQAVGQVQFAPSTVGAFTDITRRLMKQSSFDAEMIVRNDLLRVLQLELDRVGLNGSGSGQEPEGILANGSVGVVEIGANGGAPTWDTVVGLETGVAADNADIGTLGYVTSAQGRGALKTTKKDAGSGRFLWEGADLNGYQAMASNQVPSDLTKGTGTDLTALVFGNFADAVYAFWGAIDVVVDPYSLSSSGGTRVVFLADADFQLRRTKSFQMCVDIDPAA